jgi:hypothetical protein
MKYVILSVEKHVDFETHKILKSNNVLVRVDENMILEKILINEAKESGWKNCPEKFIGEELKTYPDSMILNFPEDNSAELWYKLNY